MLADAAAIAVVLNRLRIAQFAGPEFMFDTPTRDPVRGRIKKSTLHILERAVIRTRAAILHAAESILGGGAKGVAVGNGEWTRKAGDQGIGVGIIEDSGP